jgi:hypothetical protein
MGRLHCCCPACQRISVRRRERERFESAKHRRYVEIALGERLNAIGANCPAEGELLDLIDEFSDGRIQFAFVKVKDPNTTLPKNVLIAWVCFHRHYETGVLS